MDPNFSVLLGEGNKNKSCDPSTKSTKNNFTGSILAAFFSIFGVAIFGALFVRFLYPKLKLAFQVRHHKSDKDQGNREGRKRKRRTFIRRLTKIRSHLYEDEDGIDIDIERTPDMELYTEAGKFVVQSN